MSAAASWTAAEVASLCRSPCSDALMIISGLRTSCAMTVESLPSALNRSRCDISRWNRATESVSVLNVVASSRASSSSQRLPCRSTIFRVRSPVADTSRMTPVIAASGCAIVRDTVKLSAVAIRTATSAVSSSPA